MRELARALRRGYVVWVLPAVAIFEVPVAAALAAVGFLLICASL